MRIKLVIGEQDKRYLSMLTMFMEQNHMDQVEVQAFSKPELFLKNVSETTPDVVLVDESFEVNIDEIKGASVVAYLCDTVSNADERKNGIRCIEKFKKPDLIFKDLLNLYAERGGTLEISGNNDGTEFIMVTGFSGGTGASTFAAALAHKSALMDKKVLYLNLERLGMSSVFFDGEGTYNFDEVIYALKSQKTSLALKLQSAVRKDSSGVYYYAPCSSPMYMMELKNSDILQLLEAIASAKEYDRVIVDFVEQDGIVYTVMEFVEGQSFQELLNQGYVAEQPYIVKWACQLLEALNYLHTRPPYGILHADIKPANIMLRPNGDICLIDYNIALALGQNGAVRVGYSKGYASPEHYGISYIAIKGGAGERVTYREATEQDYIDADTARNQTTERTVRGSKRFRTDIKDETTGIHKTILLDVRSDIYSLGATLYHLLSGQRPPIAAPDVAPLSSDICSPLIASILQKAKLKSIFDSNGVDTSDNSIMWTMDSDKKLQYEVNSADDYIDLSVETASTTINNWKMLVKKNDQLAEEGIEYTVPIETSSSRYWLKGFGTATDANGNKINLTAEGDQNRYYDYAKVGRTFRTRINIDRSIRSQDVRFGFTVNKDEFPDFDGEIQVYEGKHKTESELSKAKNITADILNGTYNRIGRHDTTIVSVKDGSITGILPLNVIFQTEGEYLQESWELLDEDGYTVSVSYETMTSDSEPGMTIIYELAEGKPANGQYCASFEYVKNGIVDNTLVTDAFLGNFKTIKDAKNAGAKSIKDELFSDSGYKADYSAGVDVTIFVGEDDSEYQVVYHRTILTQAYTEEPGHKNNDTFVQFTGLMTKDASGNVVKVPCYFLDEYADSYGEYNFPTLMVAEDVDLSNVAPTFTLNPTVTLYAKGQKQPEKSGESFHDLTSGMLQYTAAAEYEESQRNYWLQVVKITDQKDKLFINSFTDPDAKTSDKDGVIYSTREVMLDDYHDDLHDIVLFNQGNADINNISAELESDTLELDDYWTLKGNSSLKDYEESEGANKDKSDLSDLAVNMADIRLKAKDDAEDGTDVLSSVQRRI